MGKGGGALSPPTHKKLVQIKHAQKRCEAPPPPLMAELRDMERFEHSFSTRDSLLIKTFWAGKVVQELHLTTEDELNPQPPQDQGQAQLISDALHCLTLSETSLSQKVHGILLDSEDELTGNQKPLLSDGTLNWSKISEYFDASEAVI